MQHKTIAANVKVNELTDLQRRHLAWRIDHKTAIGYITAGHMSKGDGRWGDRTLMELFIECGMTTKAAKIHAKKVIEYQVPIEAIIEVLDSIRNNGNCINSIQMAFSSMNVLKGVIDANDWQMIHIELGHIQLGEKADEFNRVVNLTIDKYKKQHLTKQALKKTKSF